MADFTMYDREREFKWQIECQLRGGTNAYIDAEDIYSGRLTRQISSGEGIEVGSCYVSELDLTIVASALPSNVVSVKPYFRLLTSTEIVDGVVQKYYTPYNLGVFKIASTKRKEYGRIDLVCYDKMADLDTLITPAAYTELLASDWKPFYLLDWIATKVNVTYTFTQSGVEAMPNGTLYFKLAEETSNIKTYRDLLQYVCMLIGAYGIFDEDGHLNVKTFADVTSYSLPASFRFSESFGDVPIVYSGVELTVKNVTTMFGNANNTVVRLSDNPFLYTLSNLNQTTDYATFIMQFLRNIYTEFQGLSYYAGEFEIPPDATLNVGRLLAVTGGGASSTINCFLQKIDVNFDGRMMLSCGNPNTYVTRTQNRTTSSITNLTNRIETLESSQGDGGNKVYTSTRIPTSSDTANEGDLWYRMNYTSSSAFDFPDWGYTLPLEYDPNNFRLEDVRSSLELRFYDTVNDIYLYFLFLGGTNYVVDYNVLGPTNTFDGFDKDTGDLQVTTENEQGTAWSYWNYIPRWDGVSPSYLIANPLGQGYSDHNMSPNVGTITYNIYSILGYASKISSGEYRLDGFRLITNGFETSWQYNKANDYNVIARWVYKENNWQVADYIAGDGVTIKNGIISANGSEIVQVNPVVPSGTQLATINGTSIYAPTVSATQTQTSGTEIATINVGDTSTKLYAPTTTVTQVLSSGTEIAQVNGTSLYAPTGGGSDVTVTPKTSTGTNIADISVDGTTYQLFAPSGGGGEPIETAFIYSNEERVVGVWTDDKPLYQKTLNLTSPSEVFGGVTIADLTSLGIENLVKVEGFLYSATYNHTLPIYWSYTVNNSDIRNSNWGTVYYESPYLKQNLSSTAYTQCPVTITIQYTKTTDTPGSAPYVTSGSYAHHYSTNEQVVGTWIDGSTLYERTYDLGSDLTLQDSTWTDSGISVPTNANRCIKAEGIQSDGTSTCIMASIASTNISVQSTKNGGDTVRYITLQYTKTS